MNYQLKSESALAYERFPGKTDIQITKPFRTPGGDEVRIVRTTGNNLILTPVGTSNSVLDSVVVNLPPDVPSETIEKEGFLGGLWDGLKSIAKKGAEVVGTVLGGSGGGQSSTVDTKVDGNGNVVINSIHINCPPPKPQ